jgi:PAS domain S-box-containing protein
LRGNLTFCNEAFIKESGYSQDEIIGVNFSNFVDEENRRKIYNAFNQVYRTENGLPNLQYKGFKNNGE